MADRTQIEFQRVDQDGDQVEMLFGATRSSGAALATYNYRQPVSSFSVCSLSEADLVALRDTINEFLGE